MSPDSRSLSLLDENAVGVTPGEGNTLERPSKPRADLDGVPQSTWGAGPLRG